MKSSREFADHLMLRLKHTIRPEHCAGVIEQEVSAHTEELRKEIAALRIALKRAGEVLYNVQCKAPGYDWNADPLNLTLANGDVFDSVKRLT